MVTTVWWANRKRWAGGKIMQVGAAWAGCEGDGR